jgi:hypothetical protein
MQESSKENRGEERHLREDAPNILITMTSRPARAMVAASRWTTTIERRSSSTGRSTTSTCAQRPSRPGHCSRVVPRDIVRSAGRPDVISHAVVGTITLTSVLIIYDGWASLSFGDAAAIIVGPVLAIFIARAFGEALAKVAAKGSPLNRSELLVGVRAECGFLLLAVPPIVLLAVLDLAGVALGDSIQVVIWLGAASLGFWGGLAGVRAGLRGWRLALAVAIGLLIGGLVLTLRVILQPGKVVSNGVAAISPPPVRGDRHLRQPHWLLLHHPQQHLSNWRAVSLLVLESSRDEVD